MGQPVECNTLLSHLIHLIRSENLNTVLLRNGKVDGVGFCGFACGFNVASAATFGATGKPIPPPSQAQIADILAELKKNNLHSKTKTFNPFLKASLKILLSEEYKLRVENHPLLYPIEFISEFETREGIKSLLLDFAKNPQNWVPLAYPKDSTDPLVRFLILKEKNSNGYPTKGHVVLLLGADRDKEGIFIKIHDPNDVSSIKEFRVVRDFVLYPLGDSYAIHPRYKILLPNGKDSNTWYIDGVTNVHISKKAP